MAPKRQTEAPKGAAPAKRLKKQTAQPEGTEDAAALLTRHGLSLPSDWLAAMATEISKPYFSELLSFVQAERKKHKVYPDPGNVMGAFNLCPFNSVRVVIIGQDPYHGPGSASVCSSRMGVQRQQCTAVASVSSSHMVVSFIMQ